MNVDVMDRKAKELRTALGLDVETVEVLKGIENEVAKPHLAQFIREGASVTEQAIGSWGNGETACALTGAEIAMKARGLL